MKQLIIENWDAVMDNRRNPLRHMDLASQHYFMQVLAWMWSMVFSLSFLSIYHFGLTWLAHALVIAGIGITVSVFKQAERQKAAAPAEAMALGHASRCVWKLDSEA
jgi:hypothetical protein